MVNEKMYYCGYWEHNKVKIKDYNFSICISNKIDGNKRGSTIQYHGIVMNNNDVATIGSLKCNLTKQKAQLMLDNFENRIRRTLTSNLQWNDNFLDKGVVKIWYYTINGEVDSNIVNDKRFYPPLRFVVTVLNVKSIDSNTEMLIKKTLECEIVNWLNELILKD